MRVLFIAIILLISFSEGRCQKKAKTHWVYLNTEDCYIKAEVLDKHTPLKTDARFNYSWYAYNKIMSTYGGADGKPLHGQYKSFYLNNNLKEQSFYYRGLKRGKSVSWNEDGSIAESSHWKNGLRNGKQYVYNGQGILARTTEYKNNELNGYETIYENGVVVSKKKYKAGKEVIPKPKKPKESAKAGEKTDEPAKKKKSLRDFFKIKKKDKKTENKSSTK